MTNRYRLLLLMGTSAAHGALTALLGWSYGYMEPIVLVPLAFLLFAVIGTVFAIPFGLVAVWASAAARYLIRRSTMPAPWRVACVSMTVGAAVAIVLTILTAIGWSELGDPDSITYIAGTSVVAAVIAGMAERSTQRFAI
jgi:hypothetical protein